MKAIIIVKDQELYNECVDHVDVDNVSVSNWRNGAPSQVWGTGDIAINLKNGESIVATGEFGYFDYMDEYGFIIDVGDE